MLDYHACAAAMDAARESLDHAQGDPDLAPLAAECLAAVDSHPGIARLGACTQLLLRHATGRAATEQDLLRRAAQQWRTGEHLLDELRTARIELELALVRPDIDNPVEVLQMALDRMVTMHTDLKAMRGEMAALRADIGRMDHIPPHPRQSDEPSSTWPLDDLLAGRRGHALVAAMIRQATSDPARAFASGVLACYAGNVAGSAYLGAVVGGPRRLHRFRGRLASNSLGAWLRREALAPDLGDLTEQLRLGARQEVPSLDADLAHHMRTALGEAYPGRDLADVDLEEGYRQLLEHLELLAGFRMPPVPEAPPIAPLRSTLGPGSGDLSAFVTPQSGGMDVSVGMGTEAEHDAPGMASEKDPAGGACVMGFLLLLTVGITYGIWCIARLAGGEKCGVEDFLGALSPDPPDPTAPTATQQMLETLREPAATNHILSDLYQLQLRGWQAMSAGRTFLVTTGLIHPDEILLGLPICRQFVKGPPSDPTWPHAEQSGADSHYVRPPTTQAEGPAQPVPFSDHGPDWLLHVGMADNEQTISEVVLHALRGLTGEPTNLDLDADRGRLHPCWNVADGTSISDAPLSIDVLDYQAE